MEAISKNITIQWFIDESTVKESIWYDANKRFDLIDGWYLIVKQISFRVRSADKINSPLERSAHIRYTLHRPDGTLVPFTKWETERFTVTESMDLVTSHYNKIILEGYFA